MGIGILRLDVGVIDRVADRIEKSAGDSAHRSAGLCNCGDCQAEGERDVLQLLFCIKLMLRGGEELAAASRTAAHLDWKFRKRTSVQIESSAGSRKWL